MSQAIVMTTEDRANQSKANLGFWIYLMTDCLLFASLFATFIVLQHNTPGSPAASGIFDLPMVLAQTIILLTSTFTCGLMMLALRKNQKQRVLNLLGVTFLLGLAFFGMEMMEFTFMAMDGHAWHINAFLSAFYTLVGTHGAHILAGLIWIIVMVFQVSKRGLTAATSRRLGLLSMFWHFLDIVWIFVFTIVYLIGGM